MEPARTTRSNLKRVALYALILTAFVMVSAVVVVLLSDDTPPTAEEAFPEPVILNLERRPNFVFPVAARTYDLSLNQFVDRFARVCMEGRYTDFRLLLSRRRPPILPPRFESNFNALKRVRIRAIEQMPAVPDVEGQVYLMSAEYELEDHAVRAGERVKEIHVALTQEEGAWRIGPIPSDALERLRVHQAQATSQPVESPGENPKGAAAPEAPRATANRPVRIDS